MKPILLTALALLALAVPATAKWTRMAAIRVPVAASTMSVVAADGWNRWSKKPIRKEELWSLDGPLLNQLQFYGGIAEGEPLAREISKTRQPLPKFAAAMHASEIAELIERTLRASEHVPDFVIETVEPMAFAGRDGFRLRYRYTTGELVRRGEARGTVMAGKLYLIVYAAPALHYFDTGLPRAVAIMDSARIG